MAPAAFILVLARRVATSCSAQKRTLRSLEAWNGHHGHLVLDRDDIEGEPILREER